MNNEKYYCKNSWSQDHSFESQEWFVAGQRIKCDYCGLYLDSISIPEFKKKKKKLIKLSKKPIFCIYTFPLSQGGGQLKWKLKLK